MNSSHNTCNPSTDRRRENMVSQGNLHECNLKYIIWNSNRALRASAPSLKNRTRCASNRSLFLFGPRWDWIQMGQSITFPLSHPWVVLWFNLLSACYNLTPGEIKSKSDVKIAANKMYVCRYMMPLGWAGDVSRIHLCSPPKEAATGSFPCLLRKKSRVGGWMDGRMDGWKDGWVDAWMEGCLYAYYV